MNLSMDPTDNDLKKPVDQIYILKHRAEFELMTFKTSYASIETDGTYSSRIDADSKLLLISNLKHAEYIAYLDENDKIILYMYRQISQIKEKEIDDGIKRLWMHVANLIQQSDEPELIEEPKASPALISTDQLTHDEAVRKMLLYNEGLVDLNSMHCDVCDSDEFFDFVLCDDKKTIEAQCANCYAIYRLVPSKYYMIHSRTIFINNEKAKINPDLLQKMEGSEDNGESSGN